MEVDDIVKITMYEKEGGEPFALPVELPELNSFIKSFAEARLAEAEKLQNEGADELAVVEGLTRSADALTRSLFFSLLQDNAPTGIALVALGGYGRRELSPHSDLDMLILHDSASGLEEMVTGFQYPLWDGGLLVQTVARTIQENVEVSRMDQRSRTSMLDSRLIAGDQRLFGRYLKRVLVGEIFRRERERFVTNKIAEMEARHAKYGDSVYMLEPNVKEGQGGLRDIQTALWVVKVLFKMMPGAELSTIPVIPDGELEQLDHEQRFLLAIRNRLHFIAGRGDDRLSYEMQEEVGRQLGFVTAGGNVDVDTFLRRFFESAAGIRHFVDVVVRRSLAASLPLPFGAGRPDQGIGDGLALKHGEIVIDSTAPVKDPSVLIKVFEAAQARDKPLAPQTLETIRENLGRIDERFRSDPEVRDCFLRILQHPRRVATTLFQMHGVRFLDSLLPELRNVFCRLSRDGYHIYTVDMHCLLAVQKLRRIVRGEYAEEMPFASRLAATIERADILFLATLLHDAGKGSGMDHSQRGGELAVSIGERFGLEEDERELLVFLVEKHLMLSETAQTRDLDDDAVIRDFARRVATKEKLDLLYLLTVADVLAVAPGVLTEWKKTLYEELYRKTAQRLQKKGDRDAPVAERAKLVAEKLKSSVEGRVDSAEFDLFIENVENPQYLLANTQESLEHHLVAFLDREQGLVLDPVVNENQGYTEAVVVTGDRPGLFQVFAGILAANHINILSAKLNSRKDGYVLDVLHVTDSSGNPRVEPYMWERVSAEIAEVLEGRADMSSIADRRLSNNSGLLRPGPRISPRVKVDNKGSEEFTIVEVHCEDRLGLLYELGETFFSLKLNIRLAKIATSLKMASDSFYLEKVGAGKITDPDDLAELKARVLNTLK